MAPETALFPAPDTVYEDELPLSDIQFAPSGATCCLRRGPGKSEVLVWSGLPRGRPSAWTPEIHLPVLEAFGFDGSQLFARSENALLRVRPGAVETMYSTRNKVYHATRSPDGTRLAWIERTRDWAFEGYRAAVEPALRPVRLEARDQGLRLGWLSDGELIIEHLQHKGEKVLGMSLAIHDREGRLSDRLLHTEAWRLELGAVDSARRTVFFFGYRNENRAPGTSPENVGAWRLELSSAPRPVCIGNEAPAGGTVALVGSGCLWADAALQGSDESTLVFSGPGRHRSAHFYGYAREFAVDPSGSTLLYRYFGARFAIRRFKADALAGTP
jgi:hypothetical protein